MSLNLPRIIGNAVSVANSWLDRRALHHPRYFKTLASLGALWFASHLVQATSHLIAPHVLPSRLGKLKRNAGAWAIVTGASDGIGKGFAFELAAQGFNVVLIARNRAKLESVAAELRGEFPQAQTKIWVADAAEVTAEGRVDFAQLKKLVAGTPVTILINNVGIANNPLELDILPDKDIVDVVVVNDIFTTLITKHVLPTLEANGPGLILNVGAFADRLAIPYMGVYSGSKGYTTSWTRGLAAELRERKSKVQVQALLVNAVNSQSNHTPVGLITPSARSFARSALRLASTQVVIAPTFWHKISSGILLVLPECFSRPMVSAFANQMRENFRQGKKLGQS
ncbi:hypothetical protein HDU87_001422 [Geranomyces variabilis]|uniref:NAD(P)-binding protein n=1 Tax=Geranomyces variabilis TaxID=109894 RepID=A0AAD5TDJ7_9FUNG|nr:hypothetical protein HDU87_001422 [Geranomyces variabilis]